MLRELWSNCHTLEHRLSKSSIQLMSAMLKPLIFWRKRRLISSSVVGRACIFLCTFHTAILWLFFLSLRLLGCPTICICPRPTCQGFAVDSTGRPLLSRWFHFGRTPRTCSTTFCCPTTAVCCPGFAVWVCFVGCSCRFAWLFGCSHLFCCCAPSLRPGVCRF